MLQQKPKVSIITVVYNGKTEIEHTLKSIKTLKYPDIEYIVIDGNSKDGTQEIINQYANIITSFVSEPDKGLYDAMNKGIRLMTGDYVWFINAGDTISYPEVLNDVFKNCSNADLIYGKAMIIDDNYADLMLRVDHPETLSWQSFRYGMNVSHQAILIHKNIIQEYNTAFKICADMDWVIRSLKKCKSVCNSNVLLCKFKTGGLSSQRFKLAWKERYHVLQKHYGFIPNMFAHSYITLRWFWNKLNNKTPYRP